MPRVLAALSLLLALLVVAPAAPARAAGPAWSDYDRPATFAATEDRDVPVTMSDGVVLRANVMRPDDGGRHPVLLIQTPYNKDGAVGAAFSGQSQYFVQRGYVVATVDVRGTGSSQGTWDSFGPAEQRDGYELVEWAAAQPWSDGKVGLFGASYMGLNQLFTAAQRPPGLKAIFPIVPMGDAYRDIVFSGGDLNTSFIPLWLGLVAAGSFQPSQDAAQSGDPARVVDGLTTVLQHVAGTIGFDVPTIVGSATGDDTAYDGPFWKTRAAAARCPRRGPAAGRRRRRSSSSRCRGSARSRRRSGRPAWARRCRARPTTAPTRRWGPRSTRPRRWTGTSSCRGRCWPTCG
jgi:predicted acyl esterase